MRAIFQSACIIMFSVFNLRAQWVALPNAAMPAGQQVCPYAGIAYLPEQIEPVSDGRIAFTGRCMLSPSSGCYGYLLVSGDDLATSSCTYSSSPGLGNWGIHHLRAYNDTTFTWSKTENGFSEWYYTRNGFANIKKTHSSGPALGSTLTRDFMYVVSTAANLQMMRYRLSDSSSQIIDLSPYISPQGHFKIEFVNDSTGYVLLASKTNSSLTMVLRTGDYGNTWQNILEDSLDQPVDFQYHQNQNIYLLHKSGKVMRSSNGGANWTMLGSAPSGTFAAIRFFDHNTGYVAGAGGLLYRTTDQGISWTAEVSNTSKSITRLYIFGDAGYFVTTDNSVFKSLSPVGMSEQVHHPGIRIFPNPTGGNLFIELSGNLPPGSQVDAEVLDQMGKKLLKIKSHVVSFSANLEGVPAGIYVLQITTAAGTQRWKLAKE